MAVLLSGASKNGEGRRVGSIWQVVGGGVVGGKGEEEEEEEEGEGEEEGEMETAVVGRAGMVGGGSGWKERGEGGGNRWLEERTEPKGSGKNSHFSAYGLSCKCMLSSSLKV